ncbi:MAG: hypothetical protein JO316_02190 [Abitibacteriaceae bacterium]|nr:hypothetical protein [Abditibacteriaceae bacterium]MBV9864138.1 hypothetical protein [Abditibacteriaceae bacterium]
MSKTPLSSTPNRRGSSVTVRCSYCINTYTTSSATTLSEARCPSCRRHHQYLNAMRRIRHWWRYRAANPALASRHTSDK